MRTGVMFLALAILLPAVSAFSCSVKNGGCGSSEKCVFTMYATGDSHISECASGYNYKVCCDELPFDCSVKTSCSASEDRIIPVFSSTDAHYYPLAGNYSVCCYKPAPNYLNCSVQQSSCNVGSVCLASVNSSTEESHAGDCGYYDYQVCCRVIDTTPPDITDFSILPVVERGTSLTFSAAIFDYSGIDRAVVCNSPAMCYGKAGNYCNMSAGVPGRYSCLYNTAGLGLGTYPFYVVANDSFGNTNSVRMDSRVRTTSLAVDSVQPQPVDLQSRVTIKANYTENYSYTVAGASCGISGDVSGTMSFDGKQYVITALAPSKLESNSFVVTCSNYSFPTLSVPGSFIARDLSLNLEYAYYPLARNQNNFLYAYVNTINEYERVEAASVKSFNITKGGAPIAKGNMVWNGSANPPRWEANFTPPEDRTYRAEAHFKYGNLDGSTAIDMVAGDSITLSSDSGDTLNVDLGSSALASIQVENKRNKDVLYNVTLTGNLFPVSFDGQALSSRRHSTFAYVPSVSSQSHPLLIKGLETSPYVKEVSIYFKETQPPYDTANTTVYYKVNTNSRDRKFAPDMDTVSMFVLLALSLIFIQRSAGRHSSLLKNRIY